VSVGRGGHRRSTAAQALHRILADEPRNWTLAELAARIDGWTEPALWASLQGLARDGIVVKLHARLRHGTCYRIAPIAHRP
jgi:hypothetical protein